MRASDMPDPKKTDQIDPAAVRESELTAMHALLNARRERRINTAAEELGKHRAIREAPGRWRCDYDGYAVKSGWWELHLAEALDIAGLLDRGDTDCP